MNIRIKDICRFGKKSDIKAGEGNTKGKYMFFTSSADKDKRIDKFDYDEEGIIMGTGGNATLHYCSGKFAVSTDCLVLLPNLSHKCKYLYYFFLNNMRVLEAGFRGAGLKHTSKSYIENIELTKTHGLLEQDKIISVLSNIDNTIVLQNKRLKLLNELVRSLFIGMFGDPVENPFKWDIIQLHKRCDIVTGNTPVRKKSEYYGNYIEWVKSDNINKDDMYLTVAEEYLSEKGLSVGRCVEAGSILMTCIAGSIGCIGNVGVANRKVAFNQQINAIVPNRDSSIFIYWLMVLSKKYIQGSVNISLKGILSKGKLSELYFPFPPIELQHKFEKNVIVIDKSKFASFPHLSA